MIALWYLTQHATCLHLGKKVSQIVVYSLQKVFFRHALYRVTKLSIYSFEFYCKHFTDLLLIFLTVLLKLLNLLNE